MSSKLKNIRRNPIEQPTPEKPESLQTDRRSSSTKEDEFPAAPNIAAKIAQRRLPRRTPTSHVKGANGDLIRRRLSKNDESRPNRYSSFERSFDDSDKDPKTSEKKEEKVKAVEMKMPEK